MATTSWNGRPFDRRVPLESDEWKRSPSKAKRKNLKKFCRGHVGREHTKELKKWSWANGRPCQPAPSGAKYSYNYGCHCYEVCSTCGKTFWRSNATRRYCNEYYENARKMREADQEARMAEFRAKYHIKSDV